MLASTGRDAGLTGQLLDEQLTEHDRGRDGHRGDGNGGFVSWGERDALGWGQGIRLEGALFVVAGAHCEWGKEEGSVGVKRKTDAEARSKKAASRFASLAFV